MNFLNYFLKHLKKTITIYNPFIPDTIKKLSKVKIKKTFSKKNLNIISVARLTDQKNHITQLKAIKYI